MRWILSMFAVAVFVVGCTLPCDARAESEQEITFSASAPALGISVVMRADLTWDDAVSTRPGDEASIDYDLQPKSGTLTIIVPLSEIPLLGLEDVTLDVPLPSIPIGTVSVPVSSLISGLPSQVGSLNVDIEGAMAACCVCSSGSALIDPACATLEWESWGTKTLEFLAQPNVGTSVIGADFAYQLSIGISASVLTIPVTLQEPIPLTATQAASDIETTVTTSEPSYALYYVAGGIAAAAIVGVVLLGALRRRRTVE